MTVDLLFAAKIPPEITEKYNYLKRSTFESLGLSYAPACSEFSCEGGAMGGETADGKYIGRLT